MTSIDKILDQQIRKWEMERAALGRPATMPVRRADQPQPIITVSRQRGTGGALLAERLADRFDFTLLHRNIIDRICETSGYGHRIVESLDEHARSQLQLWFESMLQGHYVDASDYVKQLLQVIYSLSQLGGVVVVGRGANFILGPDRGFHIRIVAPREVRVRNLIVYGHLAEREAQRELDRSDHERSEFVRRTYGRSIDNPIDYDLIINNVSISLETATTLVAAAAQEKFEKLRLGTSARAVTEEDAALDPARGR
jgi:cytidylate kinase